MAAVEEPIKKSISMGSTIVEILRMPMEMVKDVQDTIIPDFRQQIHDMPDIIKQNFQYNLKSFQELPKTFQQGMRTESSSMPMMLTKAASPLPLLSPQEIQQRMLESQKQTTALAADAAKNAATQSVKQIDTGKIIEERTRAFAEQIAKSNQEKNG